MIYCPICSIFEKKISCSVFHFDVRKMVNVFLTLPPITKFQGYCYFMSNSYI